jgi:hypothetical protein
MQPLIYIKGWNKMFFLLQLRNIWPLGQAETDQISLTAGAPATREPDGAGRIAKSLTKQTAQTSLLKTLVS